MADRLALTILGGFLGAGKTTWLRHRLHEGRDSQTHLIVNEVADEPVDDRLLAGAAGLEVIAGGCVCCAAAGRLVAVLRGLCDARSAGRGPQAVLLETSGLADPAAIAAHLRADPVLARHLRLVEVIVLVDAVDGPARIAGEPLARAQIGAADRIVLTKTDRSGGRAPDRLHATLRALAPGAEITAAVQGVAVALPPVDATARPLELGVAAGAGTGAAVAVIAHSVDAAGVGWPVLSVWLSALLHARGGQILRLKGVVDTPAGPLLLQSVGAQMQAPQRMATAGPGRLVIIGRGMTDAGLARSLAVWAG